VVDESKKAESNDPRVEAALGEYLERVDRGEAPDREAFLVQHAEIAGQLRSLITAEHELRRMATAEPGRDSAGTSTQSFALHGQETIAPHGRGDQTGQSFGPGLNGEFGRYRIVKALGKGAMGAVYLAEDTQLQRQVALKTPHFEQQPTSELLERFYREARAAATLRHPHICPVYDVGQIDGTHYISMAYIDGHPLSAFVRSSKQQQERQILIVVRKLALALQEAHDHGIVHRDLKPANIMVDKRNEPVIMDFGLARQLQGAKNIRITQSGMLIGTPAYMSPEQIDGDSDKVGPPSDQYSLGVILYELLTGQLPFRGSLSAVMAQIITKETPSPGQSRPDLDLRIEAACLKMMAKDPANRFASLSAAADELAAILKNPGGKQTSPESSGQTAAPSPSSDAHVNTSGLRQSVTKRSTGTTKTETSLAAKDVVSLEELARKCLARRDYDQVIQIIERIPEAKRNVGLVEVLEKSRAKADEISFLICEIDEAERFNDRTTALKKADELLKIKPGHHRALKAQEQFTGYGKGGAARLGPLQHFTQPWNEGGWIPWSALVFGLAVFGVVFGIIVIQLGKTAVIINVKDPGVTVRITAKGNKFEIVTGPHEEKVEVEPGEQELKISYAGLETRTKRFELKKGQKRVVTVSIVNKEIIADLDHESLPVIPESEKASPGKASGSNVGGEAPKVVAVPNPAAKADRTDKHVAPLAQSAAKQGPVATKSTAAAPPAATAPTDGFTPLFNGRDLAGWQTHPSQPGNWRVVDGVLTGSGAVASHLYTQRADLRDFDLRAEVRINDRGNSGIDFRTSFGPRWPAESPKFPLGYEAQIDNSNHKDKTGSLFVMTGGQGSGRAVVGIRDALASPNQWFTMEVIARAKHIVIKVDGKEVAHRNDSHFTSGYIALQQLEPQTVVEFRKVEIKELAPAPAQPAPSVPLTPTPGYVALFNGRDLTGWKSSTADPSDWQVENGILSGGVGERSFLYSDRGDYKDFDLRVEMRIAGDQYSNLWFRNNMPAPDADDKLPKSGYKIDLKEPSDATSPRTGSVWAAGRGPKGVTFSGYARKDKNVQPGQWFTLEVLCRGAHTVILVNGKGPTNLRWAKKDVYRKGHIAIERVRGKDSVEIRRIEIKEIHGSKTAMTSASPAGRNG
jgi:serine/threonine protein kinase